MFKTQTGKIQKQNTAMSWKESLSKILKLALGKDKNIIQIKMHPIHQSF